MSTRLSKNEISSYAGDVVPLYLVSDEETRFADIKWSVEGDACHIRGFSGSARGAFNDGVIVTLDKVGTGKVTAEYKGERYTATVTAREMKRYTGGELNYYVGDFHDHTSMNHDPDTFPSRTVNRVSHYLGYLKEVDNVDFSVISDHSDVVDAYCFFEGFREAENMPMRTVIFPGTESEITLLESDRYGVPHKNSGEIVVVNADNYSSALTYEEFNEDLSTSPGAICVLAHPQVIGSGANANGIWRFKLDEHNHGDFLEHIKLVEMGNGTARGCSILNEFAYSTALDNGFKVSTTSSSDNHDAPWGLDGYPGKTVIMATENTKEALLDALQNNRVYSTDSGNVKLRYTVNGRTAPATLEETDKYSFHVELGSFRPDDSTHPYQCRVISDYGKIVYETSCEGLDTLDFEIESTTARYFYLRFMDRSAKKTISAPVWTGRAFDEKPTPVSFISKNGFTATDLMNGADASILLNDDPRSFYITSEGKADIVIDMKEAREISALAHYARIAYYAPSDEEARTVATLVAEYEILTSLDGENYTKVDDGFIRTYGGEIILRFEKHAARYVRFVAKSTAGAYSEYKHLSDSPLTIAELTPCI